VTRRKGEVAQRIEESHRFLTAKERKREKRIALTL
jgi:hypothetical protein